MLCFAMIHVKRQPCESLSFGTDERCLDSDAARMLSMEHEYLHRRAATSGSVEGAITRRGNSIQQCRQNPQTRCSHTMINRTEERVDRTCKPEVFDTVDESNNKDDTEECLKACLGGRERKRV